jgi:MFS family permease
MLPTLASLSLMLYAAAILLGLSIGDLYADPVAEATLAWRGRHMLTGLAAALAVVFVESIVVTYFIGTGRWCKEVTETYRLPPDDVAESARLKRRTFPLALVGMLTVVGVGSLGAASDPGTFLPNTARTADIHLVAALLGFCVVAWTYYRAWLNISAQQAVINRLVAHVQRIRRDMGLDDEPTAGAVAAGVAIER